MNGLGKIVSAAGLLAMAVSAHADPATTMTVYRSPTCGCCEKWLAHVRAAGFSVNDIVTDDIQAIKAKYGVAPELASCHTADVAGYIIEGHVPADDIKALLQTQPKVAGLAVPGMPVGTPGMEMGGKQAAYDVVSFGGRQTEVFKHYPAR